MATALKANNTNCKIQVAKYAHKSQTTTVNSISNDFRRAVTPRHHNFHRRLERLAPQSAHLAVLPVTVDGAQSTEGQSDGVCVSLDAPLADGQLSGRVSGGSAGCFRSRDTARRPSWWAPGWPIVSRHRPSAAFFN